MTRHFLTGAELTPAELETLLVRAGELKHSPLASQVLAGRSVALIFQAPSTRTRVSFEAGVFELGGHPLVLRGDELTPAELETLLVRAGELKHSPLASQVLAGRSVALIFQAPSTRTRVSFEAGVFELGGNPLVLRGDELQLTRGEPVRDTALVLSRHVAAIGIRTGAHAPVQELAAYASVPVINMLTAEHHPCQVLGDLLTLRETFGALEGLVVAYVGDGNNVARSLAILGAMAGVQVRVAAPDSLQLEPVADAILTSDPQAAVEGADAVYTDVWVSMSDDPAAAEQRRRALAGYRIDDALMDRAAPHAIALHCLPAHVGEEITESVLYGDRQRIWDQAENRRHAQKALLELLVSERT